MTKQQCWVTPILCLCLFVGFVTATSSGCGRVSSIVATAGEWVVGFATEAGTYIIEKAGTFADAVSAAWKAFWGTDKQIVNNVLVDPANPLVGRYKGEMKCNAEWNRRLEKGQEKRNSLTITLSDPRMVRTSEESSSWSLAEEEVEKLTLLQKQLLENP